MSELPDLTGDFLTASHPDFDETSLVWDARHAGRRPQLIARCVNESDVEIALRYAQTAGLVVSVRSGGHQPMGYGTNDGGLVIDMRSMDQVDVHPHSRTARLGGGILAGNVVGVTSAHSLVPVSGVFPGIGYCGLALHGGEGFLSRLYGYASDHIVSARLVTADGTRVRVAADEDPDLFWALRGAGGNFGVVTELEIGLHPMPRSTRGGIIRFASDALPTALPGFLELLQNSSAGFWSSCSIFRDDRGAPILEIQVSHVGSPAIAEAEVALLRSLGKVEQDTVREMSYREQLGDVVSSTLGHEPYGVRCNVWDDYRQTGRTGDFAGALLERMDELQTDVARDEKTSILVAPGGHAYAREPDVPSVMPRRTNLPVMIAAEYGDAARGDHFRGWAKALAVSLMGAGVLSDEHPVLNSMSHVDPEDVVRAFGEDRYARLARVKALYDPANVFRNTHNVTPQ